VTFDLDRFKRAQESDFAHALAELRAGRKRSHWIWYIFPQLAGLGRSPIAQMYGLDGVDEATAYLRDPLLRERLFAAADAVREHLQHDPPVALPTLMGSDIDALKLVSSMTLFHEVARRAGDNELASIAGAILQAAKMQGFDECEYTARRVRPAF
jgi:uncharacterized protein (DUF1810 family)